MLVQKRGLQYVDAFNDIYNVSFEWTRVKFVILNNIITQKISFIKTASKALAIVVLLMLAPIGNTPVSNQTYAADIQFSPNSPYIFTLNNKQVKVEIGESEFDKAKREKEEASLAAAKIVTPNVSYYNDPSDFDPIYKAAGAQFNVPWQVLKAVHYVETGCSGSTSKSSYAGARGPMQFMPSTWRKYGVDGNGDGVADINNVNDAIYGAANLLAQAGAAEGNIDAALLSYNHAQWYVDKVKEVASSII